MKGARLGNGQQPQELRLRRKDTKDSKEPEDAAAPPVPETKKKDAGPEPSLAAGDYALYEALNVLKGLVFVQKKAN